jgi:hypothetical protein
MKLKKIIPIVVLLMIIGGIGYIATTDVDIDQKSVTETISNDRFYKDK